MNNFKKALVKVKAAEKTLHEAMIKDFPIGATVFYSHGNHERSGKISRHNEYHASLLIKTGNGCEIWLDAVKIERVIV